MPEGTTSADVGGGDPSIVVGQILAVLGIEVEDSGNMLAVLNAILEAVKGRKGGGDGEKSDADGGGDKSEAVASKEVLAALGLEEVSGEAALLVAINSLKQNAATSSALQKQVEDLAAAQKDREADDMLRPFLEANKINPNDEADMKVCKDLAKSDPKTLKALMENRRPYAEPGKTTPPESGAPGKQRETVIANKSREFDNDPTVQQLTSKEAFVEEGLRCAELKPLSEEERKGLQ